MACSGKIVAGLCYAFATDKWVYYLGTYVYISHQRKYINILN